MNLHPVGQHEPPSYPTQQTVADERLLEAAPHSRRQFAKGVAGTAMLLLTMNFARNTTAATPAAAQPTAVAPVVVRGEGRGIGGCIVVMPPSLMSEEEAMAIIREELARHGIRLARGVPLRLLDKGQQHRDVRKDSMETDGFDAQQKIAVEFVSGSDCLALTYALRGSIVQYETKKTAEQIAELAAKFDLGTMRVGIFYDPMAERSKASTRAPDSKSLLRSQVWAFVAWLRRHGGISTSSNPQFRTRDHVFRPRYRGPSRP